MRSTYRFLWVAGLLAISVQSAGSQTWPTRPIHAVVPVGAGSTTDIVPRVVFEQLSSQLGQPIVIENRGGAGGTIGSALVAKADPDGYTILVHSSAHAISSSFYPNLGYHPTRDFAAVVSLGTSPNVLVVPPSSPFRTARDLAAAAKAKPGALNFSSVGIGTATHLSAERFILSADIQAMHVPFKGGAEAMLEVVAGRIDFFFGPVGLVRPQLRDGRLRALAVNGAQRAAALPDVPTTLEAGFVDAEYPIWFGIFVPARTPREIIATLHREATAALNAPMVKARLAELGVEPMPLTPNEFHAQVEREVAVNAALVKAGNLKAE
jgi:tripartite-type tricarboxylate transporter receptor subunit TctC